MGTVDSKANIKYIYVYEKNSSLQGDAKLRQMKDEEDEEDEEMLQKWKVEVRNNCEQPNDNHEREFDVRRHHTNNNFKKISSIKQLEEMISTFSGDDTVNIENWLDKYEGIAEACYWSDLQKVMYCKRMLRGSARTFIRLEKCCFSWKQLKSSLEKKFTLDMDITTQLEHKLQIDEINKECNNQTRKTKKPALERFFQERHNSAENNFILRNTTTIKELKEKVAYYDSIKKLSKLKLHDNAHQEKQLAHASESKDTI